MTRRRPVRAWIGKAHVDPAELTGPRGLTEEVLAGPLETDAAEEGDDSFWRSLLPPRRRAPASLADCTWR